MTVFLVSDAWGEDPFEPAHVFSTREKAESITDAMEGADDYALARHHFRITEFEVDRD